MYKKYYQHFLSANPTTLHFASHSHHYWPDVTREATLQYWDDCAKYTDDKWNYWFSNEVPRAQKYIASILNFNRPSDITFASNVHSLAVRLFSCLDQSKSKRVLTTDSEFNSFSRQLKSWMSSQDIIVDIIKTAELDDFMQFENQAEKFLKNNFYDMIYISSGFYNSGIQITDATFEKILPLVDLKTIFAIDGYHSFAATPFSLEKLGERIFYLAGSYKYAQGGEGLCFMTVPKNCELKPADTGWFAHFEGLNSKMSDEIGYSEGGMRFWGSTQDLTALYRFNATWKLFESINLDVPKIHSYVQSLQKLFLETLPQIFKEKIICTDLNQVGHFLTLKMESESAARDLYQKLKEQHILTDFRGNKLRFGFGLYHDQADIHVLNKKLAILAK